MCNICNCNNYNTEIQRIIKNNDLGYFYNSNLHWFEHSVLTLQEAGGADSARPEEKLRFWYILVIQLTQKNLTFPK